MEVLLDQLKQRCANVLLRRFVRTGTPSQIRQARCKHFSFTYIVHEGKRADAVLEPWHEVVVAYKSIVQILLDTNNLGHLVLV